MTCRGRKERDGPLTIPDYDADAAAATVTRLADGMPKTLVAESVTSSRGSSPPSTSSSESIPTSGDSSSPSARSRKPYELPKDVKGLAAQALTLATAIINGDVQGEDLDRARLYASLVRTTAQLVTAQGQRSRFLRERPDLTFFDEDEDDAVHQGFEDEAD